MKATLVSLCFGMLTLASLSANAVLIEDGFESGDMSAPNTGGFSWGKNNKTSIATQTCAIYNNGVLNPPNCPNPAPDWKPFEGKYSMRFHYAAGVNEMAEQRFKLGGAYKSAWVSFMTRVPKNFKHNDKKPNNMKFFAIWMDADQSKGDGSSVFWNLFGDGNGGSDIRYAYSKGKYTPVGGQTGNAGFISYPSDQGRWMQLVMHVTAESSAGASNGSIELYRRWSNQTNFSKLHNTTGLPLRVPPGGPAGWAKGYLLGWSNPGYDVKTIWLVDNFQMSDRSLLTVDDTADPNPPSGVE